MGYRVASSARPAMSVRKMSDRRRNSRADDVVALRGPPASRVGSNFVLGDKTILKSHDPRQVRLQMHRHRVEARPAPSLGLAHPRAAKCGACRDRQHVLLAHVPACRLSCPRSRSRRISGYKGARHQSPIPNCSTQSNCGALSRSTRRAGIKRGRASRPISRRPAPSRKHLQLPEPDQELFFGTRRYDPEFIHQGHRLQRSVPISTSSWMTARQGRLEDGGRDQDILDPKIKSTHLLRVPTIHRLPRR